MIVAGLFIIAVACSSSKVVNTPDYKQLKDNKPNSIQVVTEEGREYQFSDSNYTVQDDTLLGIGLNINDEWIPFEGKIAFDEIEEVEFYIAADAWTYRKSILDFEIFEKKEGKPADIYVTKFDSERYLFTNSNYNLENDTLYGSGQSFIRKGEGFRERKLALIDLVSIQYNYTNKINVSFNYDPTTDSLIFYEDAGSEVVITMKNGKEYHGELLSVTDSAMIVFENYIDEVEDSTFSFYSINNKDIKLIEIRGGTPVILGAFLGFMIGCGSGMLVGQAVSKRKGLSKEAAIGAFIGMLTGAIGGGIIGYNTPYYKIVYYYPNQKQFDFTNLNKYTRYGNKEPEYLKKIK